MLPIYFDYIFVHLRQKVRLRPELSPTFLSTFGLNPARTQPEKPAPAYNSAVECTLVLALCYIKHYKNKQLFVSASIKLHYMQNYTAC